jgi:hypothetical protein
MPIPPVILASLLSSAPALIQSGVQFGKSLGEEDLKRPDLSIPESSKQALGIQRTLASNRNPMGYEAAVNKIDQTVNNAITGLRNAGGTLTDRMSAIADLNTKRGLALSELDIQGGKDYVNRLSSLVSGLNNYATQEARIQQDQMAEFQAESAARLARDTAAKQNLQNALGAIGQGFATNIAFNQNKDLMAQQFANQKELEQMKLDAYKSMMSGNNLPQTQQQVAQSDASASTGVLANQQGINQPTSDEIMASIFPGLSNQNVNSPYVAPFAQSDASASTGVLANQQGINQPTSGEVMASAFPGLSNQNVNSPLNLGATSPNNMDVNTNNVSKTSNTNTPNPLDLSVKGYVNNLKEEQKKKLESALSASDAYEAERIAAIESNLRYGDGKIAPYTYDPNTGYYTRQPHADLPYADATTYIPKRILYKDGKPEKGESGFKEEMRELPEDVEALIKDGYYKNKKTGEWDMIVKDEKSGKLIDFSENPELAEKYGYYNPNKKIYTPEEKKAIDEFLVDKNGNKIKYKVDDFGFISIDDNLPPFKPEYYANAEDKDKIARKKYKTSPEYAKLVEKTTNGESFLTVDGLILPKNKNKNYRQNEDGLYFDPREPMNRNEKIKDPRSDKNTLYVDDDAGIVFIPKDYNRASDSESYIDYIQKKYPGYQIKQ